MRYPGSKRRMAKEILEIVLADRSKHQWFVEPFLGGANLIGLVKGPRIGSDSNKDLIKLYKAGLAGWIPPEYISVEDYYRLREGESSILRTYTGFMFSFGGKFFQGRQTSSYARAIGRSGFRSDVADFAVRGIQARKDFLSTIASLEGVELFDLPYDSLQIPRKSIIYCDPPYAVRTSHYVNHKIFNHSHFWLWAEQKAREGHTVFVSEYTAPSFAKEVWRKEITAGVSKLNKTKVIEKLFKL